MLLNVDHYYQGQSCHAVQQNSMLLLYLYTTVNNLQVSRRWVTLLLRLTKLLIYRKCISGVMKKYDSIVTANVISDSILTIYIVTIYIVTIVTILVILLYSDSTLLSIFNSQ